MILLRSLIFNVLFYGWMTTFCLLTAVMIPIKHPNINRASRWLSRALLRSFGWLERNILNLHYLVRGRGNIPPGCSIIAAQHQSAWETLHLHLLLPAPVMVIKHELLSIPVLGWHSKNLGVITVDRKRGHRAVLHMARESQWLAKDSARPVVIFPSGTRTDPRAAVRYQRAGVIALYEQLQVPIVPATLNSGLHWPRRGFRKYPGTIEVEFWPPIPAGLERNVAWQRLLEQLDSPKQPTAGSPE